MRTIDDNLAKLVVAYYDWLCGDGGLSADAILDRPLTADERDFLLEQIEDLNVLFSITSPIRDETKPFEKQLDTKTKSLGYY